MQHGAVIHTDVLGQPIGPASRVKKSKRENTARQKLTDSVFFFFVGGRGGV
jgi:hypothetical protein